MQRVSRVLRVCLSVCLCVYGQKRAERTRSKGRLLQDTNVCGVVVRVMVELVLAGWMDVRGTFNNERNMSSLSELLPPPLTTTTTTTTTTFSLILYLPLLLPPYYVSYNHIYLTLSFLTTVKRGIIKRGLESGYNEGICRPGGILNNSLSEDRGTADTLVSMSFQAPRKD